MTQRVQIKEVDVLVIGGGFAGTYAALNASNWVDRICLLDKAFVSRSGASTMSGGITTCPRDDDDLDAWADEFITHGHYMCDRAWTKQVLEGQVERVRDFESWNVPIARDDEGKIRRFSSRGMIDVKCMQYTPKRAMEALRSQITARGVEVLDRYYVKDLLTSDGAYPSGGSVCGAFAIHTRTGECLAIVAKRTIMATGVMAMKGTHTVDNDTGDGPAMGYRAGARIVDLEFSYGGTFSKLMRQYAFGNYNVAVAHGARLLNAAGERFMGKYDQTRYERSELARVVAAFTKEIVDGRGPVYVDLRHCDESYWSALEEVQGGRGASILFSNKLPNPKLEPLPIEPTWGMWNGSRSGLKIDHKAQSTLDGLLAAGASSKNEATGTHASAGVPTAYAMNSGVRAGTTAGREAADAEAPKLPDGLLDDLREKTLEPLTRTPSGECADDFHAQLREIESSIVDLMSLNQDRLERMIDRAEEIGAKVQNAAAANVHDLVKLHEAENVAQNARLVYMSSLDRTESREQFHREDYPETDDENWFCWHGITQGPDGPRFDRAPIPLDRERYPSKPNRTGQVSTIAAIMRGTYVPTDYE